MTNQHPVTPSPFQLDQWEAEARATTDPSLLDEPSIRAGRFGVIHRKALRLAFSAGADQELEAVLMWLRAHHFRFTNDVYAARRPKPPSLKEQALEALKHAEEGWRPIPEDCALIRRAIEALPD